MDMMVPLRKWNKKNGTKSRQEKPARIKREIKWLPPKAAPIVV
jgi:hypothetical protein